jgi:hypothetical protein
MKKVINILGTKNNNGLTGKKSSVNPLFSKHAILFSNIKQIAA